MTIRAKGDRFDLQVSTPFCHRHHFPLFCIHVPSGFIFFLFGSPMTSYSPFISSGLSAIQHLTPPPSPTQLVRPDSPILPIHDAGTDITDQGPTLTAANPSQAFGAERPKLRKRRSSLTVNTSPLVQLKGSYRAATTATQRQNRSRSGSINDFSQPSSVGLPVEEVKIIGRLRSGSVGNSLRCVFEWLGFFVGRCTTY